MIERNKKLIFILTGYFLASILISLILFLITKNTDMLGIVFIVASLLILLYINIRSSQWLKVKQRGKFYKEKIKKEEQEAYKEQRNILWIFFLFMVVVTIVLCVVSFK